MGAAADHWDRPHRLHWLRDVGCLPERQLLREAIPLPLLLTVPGCPVWLRPGGVDHHSPAHGGVVRSLVGDLAGHHRAGSAAGLPPHVLLLPEGVLPVVAALAAGLPRSKNLIGAIPARAACLSSSKMPTGGFSTWGYCSTGSSPGTPSRPFTGPRAGATPGSGP